MHPIILERHRELFKDEESYEKFVGILKEGLTSDIAPILSNESVLGAVLSPEATKEVIYERMIRRLSECPNLLEDIRARIENDEIVD